ncbi:MAG: hypothetical protein KC438_14335 [Thermomicrobiales bacterium]|nr:hypothetical protein [Thermomicrobiales bacterium]MCO5220172.1 hypothetical protein [Thermomicrobiales bacterium]
MKVQNPNRPLAMVESAEAERALIEAEEQAERALVEAERAYRRSLERLEAAQRRVEKRKKAFERARAALDQCQLERASGPLIRPKVVERPTLPRPARDDSRARARAANTSKPAPSGAGPDASDSKSGGA